MKKNNTQLKVVHNTSIASGTMASSVYDLLRNDILNGHLAPGEKLRSEFLRERYKVGNSPIREALNRLSAEGLVVQEDQKGFRVSDVSQSALLELIKTRCMLEEVALRESIKNGGIEWEENIVLAFHRFSRVPRLLNEKKSINNPEWEELHRKFHMSLIAACGSSWLIGFCEQMNDLAERYRNIAYKVSHYKRKHGDEHQTIKDTVINRKTEEAIQCLHDHYNKTAKIILKDNITI